MTEEQMTNEQFEEIKLLQELRRKIIEGYKPTIDEVHLMHKWGPIDVTGMLIDEVERLRNDNSISEHEIERLRDSLFSIGKLIESASDILFSTEKLYQKGKL